jgi:excisionase family DNA binding protein
MSDQQNHFNPTEWITTKQAASLMGYDYAHVRYLLRKGKIQGMKIGRDWLVEKESALAYAKAMQDLGTAKHDPRRGAP